MPRTTMATRSTFRGAGGGHADLAKALLTCRANLDAQNSYGNTPLHVAQELGMVELLLTNGANVNATNSKASTPLHHAVHDQRMDVVKLLVLNKADVNAKDIAGETPLHWAVNSWSDRRANERQLTKTIAALLLTHNAKTSGKQQERRDTRGHRASKELQ